MIIKLTISAVTGLFLTINMVLPAHAGGEIQFADGMIAYQSRNYRAAAKKFSESLNDGNGTPEVYQYMAHSYAGVGDTKKALKIYHDMARIFKGCPAEHIALKCINRLDPKKQYRYVDLDSSIKESNKQTKILARQRLNERITVLPPTQAGHPAVSVETINAVRSAVNLIPKYLYSLLDRNGIHIYIAPNMSDKWPDAYTGSTPGMEHLKMSQVTARTYDKDIYIFERPTKNGSTELDVPFKTADIKRETLYSLGHTIDYCLGLTHDSGLKKEYDLDVLRIKPEQKDSLKYFLQPDYKGVGEVVGSGLMAIFISDLKHKELVERFFPRSFAWLKKRMETVKLESVPTVSKEVAEDRRATEFRVRRGREKVAENTAKYLENLKKEKEPTLPEDPDYPGDVVPEEEELPFTRDASQRMVVRGWINGRATNMTFEVGTHRVLVGERALKSLNIATPVERPTNIGFDPAGKFDYWTIPLEITIGRIKRRIKAIVPQNSAKIMLGEPFFRGMSNRIDTGRGIIFLKKISSNSGHQLSFDAIEIPFKLVGGKIEVVIKVEGHETEAFFNSGVTKSVLSFSKYENSGMRDRKHPRGWMELPSKPTEAVLDYIELGPIKKTKFQVLLGEHSVLGQDFIGDKHYVIDNQKKVIRFSRH